RGAGGGTVPRLFGGRAGVVRVRAEVSPSVSEGPGLGWRNDARASQPRPPCCMCSRGCHPERERGTWGSGGGTMHVPRSPARGVVRVRADVIPSVSEGPGARVAARCTCLAAPPAQVPRSRSGGQRRHFTA